MSSLTHGKRLKKCLKTDGIQINCIKEANEDIIEIVKLHDLKSIKLSNRFMEQA